MLVAVAVVPGPPAFVPELMGSFAHELDDLRHAADSVAYPAVSDLRTSDLYAMSDLLGASGPQVWPVLAVAASSDGIGEVLWRGVPYGVGWAVATWRRARP